MLKEKSFRYAIFLTLIFLGAGVIFLLCGLADYSWILFLLLPVVLGISIGALPNRKFAIIGSVIALIFLLLGLLVDGLSGFICIVMAIPIIIPFIFLGTVITHLAKRYKQIRSDRFSMLLVPLLPFLLAAPAERFYKQEKENVIEVKTVQLFHYRPDQVFDAIKSVDTLDAEKPFLMNFDLPIPTKCVLEKEAVGGIRTCHFKAGNFSQGDFGGGTITEKITEIEKGRILRMDVTDYNLIGRKWLGFKEAIYYFEKVGADSCRLTRVTTYTSELTPRIYWEPLEKIGIRQEHDYVFANLAKDLKKKYGH